MKKQTFQNSYELLSTDPQAVNQFEKSQLLDTGWVPLMIYTIQSAQTPYRVQIKNLLIGQ